MSNEVDGSDADWGYVTRGEQLSPDQVDYLEAVLEKDPSSVATRLCLLGYYKKIRQDESSNQVLERNLSHVLWMVENRPADYLMKYLDAFLHKQFTPDMVKQVTTLWIEKTEKHSKNSEVLRNAARFFRVRDDDRAATLLARAKKVNPKDPRPARDLARLYFRRAKNEETEGRRKKFTRLAIEEADRYLLIRDPERGERTDLLIQFMRQAVDYGYFEQAKRYANIVKQLYFYPWYYQKALVCLARVAIGTNNRRSLKLRLGQLQKSLRKDPTFTAYSDDSLQLVQELLAMGERELSDQYIKALISGGRFKDDRDETTPKGSVNQIRREQLREWAKEIKQGKTPIFKFVPYPKR